MLPLLTSSLLEPMVATATCGGLAGCSPTFADAAAVTTVLAAEGYPGAYAKGIPVSIPPLPDGVHAFHAGTALHAADGAGSPTLTTSGGRVLAVTAVRGDFARAQAASRAAAGSISFRGGHFRRDIGWREAQRSPAG